MKATKFPIRHSTQFAVAALWLLTHTAAIPKAIVAQEQKGAAVTAEDAARNAILHRLEALKNLTVKYMLHETYTPMPGLKERVEAGNKPGQPQQHVITEPRNYECLFRYLAGDYWFETTLVEDELAAQLPTSETKNQIDCFFGDGYEQYRKQINDVRPTGHIAASPKTSQLYPRQLIDIGLGVRAWEDFAFAWFTAKDIADMSAEIAADGTITLQRHDKAGRKLSTWQFDPQNGYALKKYLIQWTDSKLKDFEVSCSDFKTTGDLVLPHRIVARRFGPGTPEDQPELHTATMEIAEYVIDSPDNTPDSFHITWPLGTSILHDKSHKTFVIRTKPHILDEERINQSLSINNLKQIALATLNFEAATKTLPAAFAADKVGKPLLSWRVALLPFLGKTDLAAQFKLDEPWDSEHNKKLVEKMPEIYKAPGSKAAEDFKTVYLTVRGDKTPFPGAKSVKLRDITDGAAQTILVMEVSDQHAVIWTKPDDWEVDVKNPIKGLAERYPTFIAVFCDGHVEEIPKNVDFDDLNALFTRDGAEHVDVSNLKQRDLAPAK